MDISPRYNLRQNIKLRRCRKEDTFSRLPDEVIISHILSRLKPRVAAMCSFISRRWRSLWKQSISCRLIFTSVWGSGYMEPVLGVKKESRRFVSWVNRFMDLLKQKPTIDEFIIRFDLDSRFSLDINKWLSFAFTKGVEQLELDLSPYLYHLNKKQYVFPGIEKLPGVPASDLNICHSAQLRNLRNICFKHVDIAGEAIEYMLSKCHSLERVSVKNSNTLKNLNVCGGSVGLKHLKIVGCKNAEKIKISIPSLVSLKYRGSRAALCLGYVPCLSEMCIGGDYCRAFLSQSMSNLECISQLKKLKLDMTRKVVKECVNYPLEFENFVSLEQLEVKMVIYNGLFLLWPTVLIKAAPALRRFAVKFKYDDRKLLDLQSRLIKQNAQIEDFDTIVVGRTPGMTRKMEWKIKRASKHRNECLKVMEICRFVGHESDLKLTRHLLHMNLQSLEKLVLVTSPRAPIHDQEMLKYAGERQQKDSRERAKVVRKWLPSSTQLVIL